VEPAPSLETDSYLLKHAYERAVHDFAALCVRGEEVAGGGTLVAAGIPWFVALFGRDSLITAYQTVNFYPEVARGFSKPWPATRAAASTGAGPRSRGKSSTSTASASPAATGAFRLTLTTARWMPRPCS